MDNRLAILVVSLSLGACSTTGGMFGARSEQEGLGSAANAADQDDASFDAEGLSVYLEMMHRLVEADSLTQAETFREVADAADYAPTTTNRLKYALALAVPGHAGSDAAAAERTLSQLLAASSSLLPEERALATIQLKDVEQRLILDSTAERLRSEAQAALENQNAASAARLSAALEENARLRAELEDAQERLEAITAIEQSIRERENGPD